MILLEILHLSSHLQLGLTIRARLVLVIVFGDFLYFFSDVFEEDAFFESLFFLVDFDVGLVYGYE